MPEWDCRATVLSNATGPRIRELRRSFGDTLQELAELLNTNATTLSRLETGLLGEIDDWDPRIVSGLAKLYFMGRRHFDDWVDGIAPTPQPYRR